MGIFFRNSDESCIDPVAFANREGFFTDRLIKVLLFLAKRGVYPDTLYLNPRHEAEIRLQLGEPPKGKVYQIYGPGSVVKLIFSGNR